MLPRIATATAVLLSLSNPLAAQFGPLPTNILVTAVTFTVPLNLTQLPPDLERVKVTCGIAGAGVGIGTSVSPFSQLPSPSSEQYPFKQELFVTGGQVVATASIQVVVFIDSQNLPTGKTAQYGCSVFGYSKSLNGWEEFSETPSSPVFMLKPAPAIQGTFVW